MPESIELKDPLKRQPMTVTVVPKGDLEVIAHQRKPRPAHLKALTASMERMGFITPHRLPLGYGGWVELLSPRGRKIRAHCTLFRCREAVKGWYDGALYFNREQHVFDPER